MQPLLASPPVAGWCRRSVGRSRRSVGLLRIPHAQQPNTILQLHPRDQHIQNIQSICCIQQQNLMPAVASCSSTATATMLNVTHSNHKTFTVAA
jgi:hypothetical protein